MKRTTLAIAITLLAAPAIAQQQPQPEQRPTYEALDGQVQVLQMQLARALQGEQMLGARVAELMAALKAAQGDKAPASKPPAPKP